MRGATVPDIQINGHIIISLFQENIISLVSVKKNKGSKNTRQGIGNRSRRYQVLFTHYDFLSEIRQKVSLSHF
jgi:hypothetical protein